MSFEKNITVVVVILGFLMSSFPFPVQALDPFPSLPQEVTPNNHLLKLQEQFPYQQQPHQYAVLNRVASYTVQVLPEIIKFTPKEWKVNFYILGGRINGAIINGNFTSDRKIMVDDEETINGDETTITAKGVGSSRLNSQIVADDGTIIYLHYTGAFILAEDWTRYPFISLLTVITFSTDNPNYKNVVNKKYIGMGEFKIRQKEDSFPPEIMFEVTFNIYPDPH